MRKYLFGDFELDLDAFGLRLRGEPVKVERLPLDLLVLLVQRSGRLVPREEIVAALWPTRVIIDFESGLNTLVRKLRHALGDSSANPKFIETVPGRGYRFVAAVTAVSEAECETLPSSTIAAVAWRRPWVRVGLSLSVLIAAAAILSVWRAIGTEHEPSRIAVLPFEDLMGGDELTYLATGLAEDTSISLGQIDPDELRVIGSSAAI